MSGPALRPTARFENGRWRAEIEIQDLWGGSNVYRGEVAASEGEALARARRLISTVSAQEPVTFEVVPPVWR
jgi:hypothetical protein